MDQLQSAHFHKDFMANTPKTSSLDIQIVDYSSDLSILGKPSCLVKDKKKKKYCVQPFQLKQRCLSDNFIAINDDLKRFARGLYAKWNGGGRELDSGDRKRESV
jgi:hypothetical protein